MCSPSLSAPGKKRTIQLAKKTKNKKPSGQTPAGQDCQSKRPQCDSMKGWFSDFRWHQRYQRSLVYLRAPLKITNKTFVSVFGMWLHWSLSRWKMEEEEKNIWKELGLSGIISAEVDRSQKREILGKWEFFSPKLSVTVNSADWIILCIAYFCTCMYYV